MIFVKLAHVCVGITNWLDFVGFTELLMAVVCLATPLFGPCRCKGWHLSCENVCLRREAAIVYRHFPFACAAPYSGTAVRSNGCWTLLGFNLSLAVFAFLYIVPPRPSPHRTALPSLFCFPACVHCSRRDRRFEQPHGVSSLPLLLTHPLQ